jgi:hypothetical protein
MIVVLDASWEVEETMLMLLSSRRMLMTGMSKDGLMNLSSILPGNS